MALAFGEKTVSKAYLGEKAVSAIYLGTKKVFPDEEEAPAAGDIRLRIETASANQSFPLFYRITTEEGGYVSVDWGDGNKETLTDATTYTPTHTYATAGEYVVKLTGSKFTAVDGTGGGSAYEDFQEAIREILSLKMPTDSTSVSLDQAFFRCTNLTGNIPAWDDCITSAYETYYACTRLTGNIPEWGANITNARNTYYACRGLTGSIPAWGESITSADGTYNGCTGLTGSIPAWGENITNAYNIYRGCSGLTGSIPEWGAKITNAQTTYHGCSGLTGSIPAWGANITTAQGTYNSCAGLTGEIPEWGANITDASFTYYGCRGLTGCSEELLRDPMPSRITIHGDCVSGCADAIRQHFTADWGGTKA